MYSLAIRYRYYGPRLGPWHVLPNAATHARLRDAVAELERSSAPGTLRELPHGAYACDLSVVRVRDGKVVKVMYEK